MCYKIETVDMKHIVSGENEYESLCLLSVEGVVAVHAQTEESNVDLNGIDIKIHSPRMDETIREIGNYDSDLTPIYFSMERFKTDNGSHFHLNLYGINKLGEVHMINRDHIKNRKGDMSLSPVVVSYYINIFHDMVTKSIKDISLLYSQVTYSNVKSIKKSAVDLATSEFIFMYGEEIGLLTRNISKIKKEAFKKKSNDQLHSIVIGEINKEVQ